MSSALGQVQNPTNVSQPLPAEESSGSNWVSRARIASQVALPVIMNTAFVLSMVASIIFPPATVFLLIGIGVTAGLLWHLIPDPYAGLGGSSPQVDTPSDKPVPKDIAQLGVQQDKDKASLQAKQAQRREDVLKTYPDGNDKDRIIENLDQLDKAENEEQDLEQEIERRQVYFQKARERMLTKHKKEQGDLDGSKPSAQDDEELFQMQKDELKKLEQEFERIVEPKREDLAQIKKQKEMNQAILSYELGKKDLEKRQIERRKELEGLRTQKDPNKKYIQPLRNALDKLEGCEKNELQNKYQLKIAELKDEDQGDITNKCSKVDEAEKELRTAQKTLADLISEIDPGLSAQIGTAFQAMGSMMGSAIQTARSSSGVLFEAPARVRDLLSSSSVMTSRLAPVGRWIGGVPGRIMGSLPSFDDARNSVAPRPYGIEDSADKLLRESSSQAQSLSASSFDIEMDPFEEEVEEAIPFTSSSPPVPQPRLWDRLTGLFSSPQVFTAAGPHEYRDNPDDLALQSSEGGRNLGNILLGASREHNVQNRIMDEENL